MKHRTLVGTILAIALAAGQGCSQSPAKKGSAEPSPTVPSPTLHALTIHQEVDFDAPPDRLYAVLLDSKRFTDLSGAPAQLTPEAGGPFSAFGGHIIGRNLELVENQRVVQAWRAGNWPAGVYSVVRFQFTPRGTGTHLVFDQTGFPDGEHDSLSQGWENHYWTIFRKGAHSRRPFTHPTHPEFNMAHRSKPAHSDPNHLDLVFRALGDRTRRSLLAKLAHAPAMVTELAEPFDMSLPAISRHIRVLERARLIARTVDGRIHRCSLRASALHDAQQWLDHYRVFWEGTLDSLSDYVENEDKKKHTRGSTHAKP